KGTIKIIKVDETDPAKKLKDAKFIIKDKNGNQVDELVTDANGEAVSQALPIGEYSLEETEAPYGYVLSTEQDLSITVTAETESVITVTNKQLKGSIKIIKVNADDSEQLLEGAKFELVDE